MASVSAVSLSISNGSTANNQNVTVSGTMQFDAGEVGKSYRLEIKIFGEDKPGDNLPSTDPVGDDELYAFLWGANIFNKKPYKQFTVAAAGPQTFKETRPIRNDKLDEDSGSVVPGNAPPGTPGLPRQDELYAQVSLSGAPASARSATLNFGIGV
ncbi:MAG: hypothetical protein ACKV22_18250 [Bryobacteraceae bacterium]